MAKLMILLYEKYKYIRHLINMQIKILDIGCGNGSPSKTKGFFKNSIYHGVDIEHYNLSEDDFKCIDKFFKKDLNVESLSDISDNEYDYVILSHILEHLKEPYRIVEEAASKCKKGGYIYIEFPSLKSFRLPSMKGSLHFSDDSTHIRFVEIAKIINILLDFNFKIIKAGRRRNWFRIIFMPIFVLWHLINKKDIASDLWDLLGFADQIIAQRYM